MIDLSSATFIGPELKNSKALADLPLELRALLTSANGFIVFDGGLHVRGVCDAPEWHSLYRVSSGPDALSRLYQAVQPGDIPFAQDFLGDQFLLRDGSVLRLSGETGELEDLKITLNPFFDAVSNNPDTFLSLNLLRGFCSGGAMLEPGKLLSVYPPLCTVESASGVSVRPVPALERIRFLADFASQIAGVPDGECVRLKVK